MRALLGGATPMTRACLFMLLMVLGYSFNTLLIRTVSAEIHTFEIAMFRNLFGFAVMLPWIWRNGLVGLRTRRPGLHALRGVLNWASMVCFFYAIAGLPLAQATALNFTLPLFVAIGAAVVLGEVMRVRRWSATLVGFLGVLIILRPGVVPLDLPGLAAIASAAGMAAMVLAIKVLGRTDGPHAIVILNLLIALPLSIVPALLVWRTPSLWLLALMALHGAIGTYAQLSLTRAMALADASAIMPLDFLRLPTVALFAWLAFGEVSDVWTWVGGGVIFAATAYIARREAVTARQATTGIRDSSP